MVKLSHVYRLTICTEDTTATLPLHEVILFFIVARFAHISQIVMGQRHIRVVDVCRCQRFFVVNDVSHPLSAHLTDAAIDPAPFTDVRCSTFLPRLGIIKCFGKLFHSLTCFRTKEKDAISRLRLSLQRHYYASTRFIESLPDYRIPSEFDDIIISLFWGLLLQTLLNLFFVCLKPRSSAKILLAFASHS